MEPLRRYIFPLLSGWGGVAATGLGLVTLIPYRDSRAEVEEELEKAIPKGSPVLQTLDGNIMTEKMLRQLASELADYHQGKEAALDYPVDWESTGVTDFQRMALEACKKVPYGTSATYGSLAKAIGNPKASRAIGGAMHINPVSLVVP